MRSPTSYRYSPGEEIRNAGAHIDVKSYSHSIAQVTVFPMMKIFAILCLASCACCDGFMQRPNVALPTRILSSHGSLAAISTIEEASQILEEWDKYYNPDKADSEQEFDAEAIRPLLPEAVRALQEKADEERAHDSTKGRCMLGICASSTEEGVAALKSWVTSLQLPRGLLHGMDKEGVPIEIEGAVYIKYNTGGSATFADIRKSGIGFDALWKPGDALLEPYDGTYRGVYFQVELLDGVFRQYLLPLDTFVLQ